MKKLVVAVFLSTGCNLHASKDTLHLYYYCDVQNFKTLVFISISVERGILELRKLGIEQQLWEASRREIELASPTNHE